MEALLLISIVTPLVVALCLAVYRQASEGFVARVAQAATVVSAVTSLAAIALWLVRGGHPVLTHPHVLFARDGYRFAFELVLDAGAVVFLLLVQFMTGMVVRFSRFYLHREPGFRRFFATVLLFQGAMCILTLAANLDLMFAGWEMVGLSSFLLIAFYWERRSAARNALKVYSVYRVADMGMLLAACLETSGSHRALGLLLLLAAIGKSAQFPFSFWLPRAMEGPTPSSALFYGALSVHAGAYLLMRTFNLWGDVTLVRICIGGIGLVTAALCTMFARVQSTIKGQVGYASVTQVGLMFVELALGFRHLAMLHMVCNALLRCYQLLISPSAVAYILRRQASAGSAQAMGERSRLSSLLPERWISWLYVFALSEGYLKETMKLILWSPFRWLGKLALPKQVAALAVALCVIVAVGAPYLSTHEQLAMGFVLASMALLFSGLGLGSWRSPVSAMIWISGSSMAIAAAVLSVSPRHNSFAALAYAAAITLSCGLGVLGVAMVVPRGSIKRFAGLAAFRPMAAACSLTFALGIAGFPLLPTFLYEDLLLHHMLHENTILAALVTGLLALNGYLAVRTFVFVFLGKAGSESRVQPRRVSGLFSSWSKSDWEPEAVDLRSA